MNLKMFLKKLVEIVDYLHQNKIVHRDIKLSNILISDDGKEIKLIDFGVAKKFHDLDITFSPQGDFRYRAPEMVKEGGYNEMCDIWGCSLLVYSLLYGHNVSTKKILEKKYDLRKDFEGFSENFFEIFKKMSNKNPDKRISAKEILKNSWLEF